MAFKYECVSRSRNPKPKLKTKAQSQFATANPVCPFDSSPLDAAAVRNFNRFAYMANGGLLKKKKDQERAENETGELGTWSVPKSGRYPKLNGKMSEF